MSMARSTCRLATVPALLDVDLACHIHTKAVGNARAGKIVCQVHEAHGTRYLNPPSQQQPSQSTDDAAGASGRVPWWGEGGEAGGRGEGMVQQLLAEKNLIYGTVTAQGLKAALLRRGYQDCEVVSGGRTQRILSTVRVPSLWAEVELEAERCRVESGVLGSVGRVAGGEAGDDDDDDDGSEVKGVRKKRKATPDREQLAAAAAIIYEVILELVVEV